MLAKFEHLVLLLLLAAAFGTGVQQTAAAESITFEKMMGDLVPAHVLGEGTTIEGMRIAARLVGRPAWPVSQDLYVALHEAAHQICSSFRITCEWTVMASPMAVTHGLDVKQAMHYPEPKCAEECQQRIFPELGNTKKCEECARRTPVFHQAEYGSIDLHITVKYASTSVLMGTSQSNLGAMMEGVLHGRGVQVAAFQIAYTLLPAARVLQPFLPIDPQALRFQAWDALVEIEGSELVPWTLERENMLLLLLRKQHSADARSAVQFFRPGQVDNVGSEGKAHIHLLINRLSGKHLDTVEQEWERYLRSVSGKLPGCGSADCHLRLLHLSPLRGEALGDQLDRLARANKGLLADLWYAGPPLWPTLVLFVALLAGAIYHNCMQKPACTPAFPVVAPIFSAELQDGSRKLHRVPLRMGSTVDYSDIEILRDEKGADILLGTGATAKVYKGLKNGVQEVAIKVLQCRDQAMLRNFEAEIDMIRKLSFDQNVVQFYGVCLQAEDTMLLTEYMAGGDLMQAIAADRSNDLRWSRKGGLIAMDIVRGLVHLHSNSAVHMDIKSKNILLTMDQSLAKIADVGLSRFIRNSKQQDAFQLGTFEWTAPELLLGRPGSTKVDIYSLGVVLWEIVTHLQPQRGQMREVRVPQECPAEIKSLVSDCMHQEPEKRPTAKEVYYRLRNWRNAHAEHLRRHKQAIALQRIRQMRNSSNERHSSDGLSARHAELRRSRSQDRASQAGDWMHEERRAQSDTVLPGLGCAGEREAVEPTATSGPSPQPRRATAPPQPSSSASANSSGSRQGRQPLRQGHGQQAGSKDIQGGGGGGGQPDAVPEGLFDTAMQSDNRQPG